MSHLTHQEFVELIDGALPPGRTAHVNGCERCRQQAEDLRQAAARVSDVEAAEPSPLFWEHFSANVRQAIDEVGAPDPRWRGWLRPAVLVPVSALAAIVFAVILWSGRPSDGTVQIAGHVRPAPARALEGSTDALGQDYLDDLEADEAWALVRTVADEMAWDEAHEAALTARPGAAERMTAELTERERFELARLLRDELRRTGA
jgi:hypothetical protein